MMAVTENKPFTPDPAIDFDGSIAGLLFEVQIATTALRFGIQMLGKRTDADPLREELAVLQRLSSQNCEAMEALQKVILDHLTRVA
jgi:hypothetical protein